MTFSRSLRVLLAEARPIARDGVAVYAFGSATRAGEAEPSDIDLLIVYENKCREDALAMRQRLIGTAAKIGVVPLDFVILTVDEQAELDFIAAEQAIRIV
jgi:predicted nucleotidyltransferase